MTYTQTSIAARKATALITGASAGLGAEFATQLARRGCDLILVARREAPMQALAGSLSQAHDVRVTVIPADLSQPEAPQQLFREVAARDLTVDYLINNAGAAGPDLLSDADWSAQRSYLELMMTSVAAMCHFFVKPMRDRGFGRVLNVASVAGRLPLAGEVTYGPTKAFVIALSEALHTTLRREGVHVSALCPGFTHTDFHTSDELAEMKAATPKWLWYDAEVVVRDGLSSLDKGKAVCISGRLYRWLDPWFQSVWSRPLLTALARRGQPSKTID